jgi:hypothetical protein
VKTDKYELRIKGSLSPEWADWFEGMEIRQLADGNTVLEGRIVDQAALHGLLARIRDLNLTLISVNPETEDPAKDSRDQGDFDEGTN